MSERLFELLKSRIETPLNLLDVGAAGGVIDGWGKFGDRAHVFCFEARDEEAGELSTSNANLNVRYIPIALSNNDEGFRLTVAENPGCSSVYPPVEAIYKRYPGNSMLRPMRQIDVPTTTVDQFMKDYGLETIHAMKLDTQGSELDILRGAEKALSTCLFLNVEAEFNELYDGQALFCDVDRFLRDRGFVLWRLNNLAHYSTGIVGGDLNEILVGSDPGGFTSLPVSHGQLFWGDALYVRQKATAVSTETLSVEESVAGAALVTQWRFYDLALEMIRKSGDAQLLAEAQALLGARFVDSVPKRLGPSAFRSNAYAGPAGDGWRIDFSVQDTHAIYGPYIRLPQGSRTVTFRIRTEGLASQLESPITFDVTLDRWVLNSSILTGSTGAETLRSGRVSLPFSNDSPQGIFEFRIRTEGRPFEGALVFEGVEFS